ncbi:MAG: hypothetical protein VKK04_11420 [Synechococcales bacterium]|nr:hypothetical protein [Synechococcales bacterium]
MNAKTKSDASPKPSPKSASPASKTRSKQSTADASARPSSVPISVYRELAAELKNTKILLEAVTAQNQQLLTQNQQLRHEAEQILAATQSLRHLMQADVAPPVLTPDTSGAVAVDGVDGNSAKTSQLEADLSPDGTAPKPQALADEELAAALNRVFAAQPGQPPISEASQSRTEAIATPPGQAIPKISHTEQSGGRIGASAQASGAPREMSNLWLVLTVIVVIITAFGAGFLMVLPFIQQPNNNR